MVLKVWRLNLDKDNINNLGDRIRNNYEDRFRFMLPRRTYTIIRLDGKSFHNYTRNCEKPFDYNLIADLDSATCLILDDIQGSVFAFNQSDEISILVTDFKNINTEAWFDGNVQKIVSVSASMLTAKFNEIVRTLHRVYNNSFAYFDSRVFIIPDAVEVENYFIWRQKDAVRNSINAAAGCYFSDKELEGKSCEERQEMLFQKGINWNDYPDNAKRGRIIKRNNLVSSTCTTREWYSFDPPVFTQDRTYLQELIKLSERED